MKRINKREELIRVGKELIGKKSFNSTGLNDILTTANIPKGSFYYYFASKEDFGLAIIDSFAEEYRIRLEAILEDPQYPPLIRLRNYFEVKIAEMEASKCTDGCLIGNLAQELSSQNEQFRDRLEGVFAEWEGYFVRCLQSAYNAGEISHDCHEDLARFILSSWEGAILQAKVTKSVVPMKTFVDILFTLILIESASS